MNRLRRYISITDGVRFIGHQIPGVVKGVSSCGTITVSIFCELGARIRACSFQKSVERLSLDAGHPNERPIDETSDDFSCLCIVSVLLSRNKESSGKCESAGKYGEPTKHLLL